MVARTNIEIDQTLVRRAMRLPGARTTREVVLIARQRSVSKGELYRAIRRARGQLQWEGDVPG